MNPAISKLSTGDVDGTERQVDGEIISALREAEVRLGQGETVGKICRGFGIDARRSPAGVVT